MPGQPKSQYKFTPYLYGPRAKRTYLDDGGGAFGNNLDELMLDRGAPDPAPLQVEEYFGRELPGYVRDQGFRTDFDIPGAGTGGVDTAHRTFNGPGAHLALAGETVPRISPDLLAADWRKAGGEGVKAAPNEAPAEPPAGLPSDMADLKDVSRREIEHLKNYPTMQKPKWWQSALGGAAGFGAGWSNAASRTKHPIDIGAMTENITHPGYADEVARWRGGMAPLQMESEIQGNLQTARGKQEGIEALSEQRKARADEWRAKADPHFGKEPVSPEIGKLYVAPDEDGTYWMDKSDLAAHIRNQKQTQDKAYRVGDALVGADGKVIYQGTAKKPNVGGIMGMYLQKHNGDEAAALEDYRRDRVNDHVAMRAPTRVGGAVAAAASAPGMTRAQRLQIENRHQSDSLTATNAYNRDVAAAAGDKVKLDAARIKLDAATKQIESAYRSRIAAALGQQSPAPVGGSQPPPAAGPATRQGGVGRPIKSSPTSVVLPDGRTKHFPNEAAVNAFLDAVK